MHQVKMAGEKNQLKTNGELPRIVIIIVQDGEIMHLKKMILDKVNLKKMILGGEHLRNLKKTILGEKHLKKTTVDGTNQKRIAVYAEIIQNPLIIGEITHQVMFLVGKENQLIHGYYLYYIF